ncbi:hypothetical protein HD554DRAFT_1448974 [Boletus coccyginus]|nr:hypothetical protein HD554DRAFT_1448974 [Boletus coccyginus]
MFARLASVFITLVLVTGEVAASDDCTDVCCESTSFVSGGVVCCVEPCDNVDLAPPEPYVWWFDGIRLFPCDRRRVPDQLHVLPSCCEWLKATSGNSRNEIF